MKDYFKNPPGNASSKLTKTKLSDILCADRRIQSASDDDDDYENINTQTSNNRGYYSPDPASSDGSPYHYPSISPYSKSPWVHASATASPAAAAAPPEKSSALLGSLVREEGHVYSLAASGDLLYTGSESKNIRVWKRWREFSGFKSSSGLVKAIVIADGKIFTGHQDGKIRVWRVSPTDPAAHRRVGTLPRMKDFLKSSINPYSYVEVRRHRSAVWLRHFDAVSCLSLDAEHGILYSGSWDKTVKVWRIADSKCLESINAHDDAVNSVAVAGDGMVYTGSADGTVKLWKREWEGRRVQHVAVKTLLEQESAVTALAVAADGDALYCGSSDGLVNYWWGRGAAMVRGGELRGHRMAVLCIAAAGGLVISGSADKTLCVWRRDDGGEHVKVSVLAGHGGPIKCLAVEEDRQAAAAAGDGDDAYIVYSGSLDRSVKVWRVLDRRQGGNSHVPSPSDGRSPVHVRGAPLGSSLRLGHVVAARASVS